MKTIAPLLLALTLLLLPGVAAQERLDTYRRWAESEPLPTDLRSMLVTLANEDLPELDVPNYLGQVVRLQGKFEDEMLASADDPIFFLVDWSVRLFHEMGFHYLPREEAATFGPAQYFPTVLLHREGDALGLASLILVAVDPFDFPLHPAVVGQFLFLRFEDSSGTLNLDLTRNGEETNDDILIDEYTRTPEGERGTEEIQLLDTNEFVGFFLLKRAQARIAADRLTDARIDLEGARYLFPSYAAIPAELGDLLTRMNDSAGALAAYQRAAELGSRDLTISVAIGKVLAQRGKLEEALATFERILQRDPEDPRGYLGLASIHGARGAPKEGVEVLDRYLERFGTSGRVSPEFLRLHRELIARSQLAHLPEDNSFADRIQALHRIGQTASTEVIPDLLPLLDDPNYRIRWGAAHALGRILQIEEKALRDLGLDRAAWTTWIEQNPRSGE